MAVIARPDSTLPFRTSSGGTLRVNERDAIGKASETTLSGKVAEDTVSLSEGTSPIVDPLVYNLQRFADALSAWENIRIGREQRREECARFKTRAD